MESARRNTLKKLMAAMAAGDPTAAFRLRMMFEPELKAAVRRAAVEVGRALPSDEVEAVATDFCTWLISHAARVATRWRAPVAVGLGPPHDRGAQEPGLLAAGRGRSA